MTGTISLDDTGVVPMLLRRLRSYQTVAVSDNQRIVLIPPIGSFLVDWDARAVRLHIAASSQRDLDELLAQLDAECKSNTESLCIDWAVSASVPVPFR